MQDEEKIISKIIKEIFLGNKSIKKNNAN